MLEFINVALAAGIGFAAGAVWYMLLAEPWMSAAGIRRGLNGSPEGGQSPTTFALTFVLQLLVAGMLRHIFEASGITTLGAGIVSGAGIGLFIIAPWVAINNLYGMRPRRLTLIDGGYATVACALMGAVLTIF